jgi:hypothetical protein
MRGNSHVRFWSRVWVVIPRLRQQPKSGEEKQRALTKLLESLNLKGRKSECEAILSAQIK